MMKKILHQRNRYVYNFSDSLFNNTNNNAGGWGSPQEYPAYIEIYRQDTPAVAVYFIEHGMVKLSRVDRAGHEVIAGLRRRHWVIGAPAVLRRKPYSFTCTTLTRCSLRCISAEGFMHLVETNKAFNRHILAMLCQEIYTHAMNSVDLGCLPARDRLKQLLIDFILQMEQPSDLECAVKFQLPLKHKELAQMIAVTPEHLSRLLKTLEHEGLIQRKRNWLEVKDCRSFISEGRM